MFDYQEEHGRRIDFRKDTVRPIMERYQDYFLHKMALTGTWDVYVKLNDAVFDLIDKVSESYKNEKGLPPTEAVPLCGRWDSNPHAQGTRS